MTLEQLPQDGHIASFEPWIASMTDQLIDSPSKALDTVINHAVVVFDSEGRIIRENAAARLLPKAALAGTAKLCDAPSFEETLDAECCPIRSAFQLKRAARAEFYDETERRWFRQTAHPLLNEQQNINGAVLVVDDITEQKEHEEKLKQSLAEIERLKDCLRAESEFLTTDCTSTRSHG